MSTPEINVESALKLFEAEGTSFVDIRDPDSYQTGHVPGAERLHDGNLEELVSKSDKSKPVVVYCYKGRSSLGVTDQLLQRGFTDVRSLSGGFEAWQGGGGKVEQITAADQGASSGLSITKLAKEKLLAFLKDDSGSSVRVMVDPSGSFNLSLDARAPGDVNLEVDGVPFVLDPRVASSVRGLEIDFLEKVQGGGFSLKGGSLPERLGKDELLEDIKKHIADNKIMIFIKGTASAPMCGFSATTVQNMRNTGKPFGDKNVLEIPEYRYVLSEHSSWPTIPQIFIDGKFVGGCDIIIEMSKSGELQKLVDTAFAD